MSRLIVDAPPPPKRRFGLYTVADVKPAEGHALMGIEYEKNWNCNWDNIQTGTTSWCATTSGKTMTEGYAGTSTGDAFYLYALDECAGINEFNVSKDRAVSKFTLGEERGVEARLQAVLAADAGAVNLGASVPSLKKAISILEEWLDANYAGVGTILASRAAASLMSDGGVVARHGNRLETVFGSGVAGSFAFGTKGPAAATPAAGSTYLWAVGMVEVRRGSRFVADPVFIQTANAVTEVQTVAITGVPTGGTFTLSHEGDVTGNIAYNAVAATVQTQLQNLPSIGSGNVTVTGTNPNFTVTFAGALAGRNASQITVASSSLTGGTTPRVTAATTTQGSGPAGDNSYRTLAEQSFVLSYDCAVAAQLAVLA